MAINPQREINEYAKKSIKHDAKRLVDQYRVLRFERPDVEQELFAHLLERLPNYDPRRGNLNTFINQVVDRKIISMLRERFALRRDFRRSVSLDVAMEEQEEDVLESMGQLRSRFDPHQDLAVDLNDALESLDGDTQRLCKLLMHHSIAETARRLGLTRTEARTRISSTRALLTGAGLEVYLDDGPAKSNNDCVCNK